MKRFLIALLACTLIFGYCDVQAQSKTKSSAKTSKSAKDKKSKKNKKGKKGAKEEPTLNLVQLPYNSNDCLFAIPLSVDQTFGPTTAPQGAGRVMEVMADKRHPNLPEFEHNSVWYKFTVPYNGKLDIAVTQLNLADDYDQQSPSRGRQPFLRGQLSLSQTQESQDRCRRRAQDGCQSQGRGPAPSPFGTGERGRQGHHRHVS